jgi:serine protease Do
MTYRIFAALIAVTLASAPVSAQSLPDRASSKFLAPFRTVVQKANESTIRVRCDDKDAALGTVVFADGYILTKASELKGAITARMKDGAEYEADVVAMHKETDLALLKVDVTGLTPVSFAETKMVPVGNWLAAAGPGSDASAVGIVSVKTRTLRIDPLDLMNANRGFLGVFLDDAKDDDGKVFGARVRDFGLGRSAGRTAGLKVGDVILGLDDKSITSQQNLRELLDSSSPGQKVTLKVKRDGKNVSVTVTLAAGEKSRGDIQNSMGGELSGRRTGFPAVLQTDMVVEPKNCGGPVVDLDGNVLGINIARAGRVETWILPSENIRPLLTDMKAGKFPPVSLKKEKEGSK